MASLPERGVLMVPIANPDTVDRLLEAAVDIARDRAMQILAIHVVEVPPQVPLSEGARLLEGGEQRRLLDAASDRCTTEEIECDTRIRYARDVATGIVGAVDEHEVDVLLMGWRGRPRRRDIVLGSFLDRVLAEAQCDVLVKRIRTPPSPIRSILVPVAGGPHCALSVALAEVIARQRDASVQLVHVHTPDVEDPGTEMLEGYATSLGEVGVDARTQSIGSDNVAGAITDASVDHDLTILGATREPFLKRKLVGSVAEGVGRTAASQVILTRRHTP